LKTYLFYQIYFLGDHMKTKMAIILIVLMLSPSLLKAIPLKEETIDIYESHIINDVGFVGQENRFYCTLACQTMILNYYGYNFSRYEVFYLMGGGFSLHWHERSPLSPYPSAICSIRPSNYEYVGTLLNLTFQPFSTNLSASEDVVWTKVWTCIIENVSCNQPVLINLDAVALHTARFKTKIPLTLLRTIPITINHAIIVVGYNQSNQSICYHDPGYDVLEKDKDGSYIWVDVDLFKDAFFTYPSVYSSPYLIQSYKKPQDPVYDKATILEHAYQRNIKRLQGDFRYYTSPVDHKECYNLTKDYIYGINASKKIQSMLGEDFKTQLETLYAYKKTGKFGIKNTCVSILDRFIQRFLHIDLSYTFDCAVPGYRNNYRFIAEEKQMISEVLQNYSHLSPLCRYSADLLQKESLLWFDLASYNRILMNKGIFISSPRAVYILNHMTKIMDEIIEIQQDIIRPDL